MTDKKNVSDGKSRNERYLVIRKHYDRLLVPSNHHPKAHKVLASFYSNIFEILHNEKKNRLSVTKSERYIFTFHKLSCKSRSLSKGNMLLRKTKAYLATIVIQS